MMAVSRNVSAELVETHSRCAINFSRIFTIPLLAYDTVIHLALTGLFIALLWPHLQFRRQLLQSVSETGLGSPTAYDRQHDVPAAFATSNAEIPFESQASMTTGTTARRGSLSTVDPNIRRLENLIVKSLVGTIITLASTIMNMGLFIAADGHEMGWVCLTVCTFDSKSTTRHAPYP